MSEQGDEWVMGSEVVGQAPWRVGRKVGRTIYDANNVLIGVMDTPELAAYVVYGANRIAPRITRTERSGLETIVTTEYAPLIEHFDHEEDEL